MDPSVYYELYATEDTHWWFRGRRAVIHALLERAGVRPPVRGLDAGCGTGRNLVEFKGLGDLTGVEPSASAVAFCKERGLESVVQAHIEQLPFDDETFDLVFAFDVLEHLDDDRRGLRELRRVARPGATLVATVPAYRWLWSQHDDTHQHRRRYVRPQLLAAAQATGWLPLFATYFNSLLLPGIAAVRAFRRGKASSSDYEMTGRAGAILELPMRIEARAIQHGARLPIGVSIGMVCSASSNGAMA